MRQNVAKIDFPWGSEFIGASGGPQNGGKMTGMDILEFRDINSQILIMRFGLNGQNTVGGQFCRIEENVTVSLLSSVFHR